MSYLSAIRLGLVLLLLLSLDVLAQPRFPDEPLEDIYILRIENLVTLRESLRASFEFGHDDQLVQAWSVPAIRFRDTGGQPLFLYKNGRRDLVSWGPQLSRRELPLGLPLEFTGLRWSHRAQDWDFTVVGGELLRPGLSLQTDGSKFIAANVGGLIMDEHLLRFKLLRTQSDFKGPSNLVEMEFQPDLGPGTQFWTRLGADFNGERFGQENMGLESEIMLRKGDLFYSLYHRDHGLNYARQLYNPFAGSSFTQSKLEWSPTRSLSFFQDTTLTRDELFGQSSSLRLQERFLWTPGTGFYLTGDLNSGTTENQGLNSTFLGGGLSVDWLTSDRARLNAFWQQSRIDSFRGPSTQQSLGARFQYQFSDRLGVSAEAQRNSNSLRGARRSRTGLGLGLNYRLPDELGYLNCSASKVSQETTTRGTTEFLSWNMSANVNPSPRLRLGANVSTIRDLDLQPRLRVDASIDYLLNEALELGLTYHKDPFLGQIYPFGGQENFVGLELRQSLGGPVGKGFRRRLKPRLTIEAIGETADGITLPLQRWPVTINGEVAGHTDQEGLFRLSLVPGKHHVSVVTRDTPVQYVPVGSSESEVTLKTTERRKINFKFKVNSGLRVVAFNDFKGSGKSEVGYTPLPGLKLILDDEQVLETDLSGSVLLNELKPGRHTLELLAESVPAGFQSTLPLRRVLELQPGTVENVEFGFQGQATFQGRVVINGLSPGESSPRFWIKLNGEPLVRTEREGSFSVPVPAGQIELELGLGAYSDRFVLVGSPSVAITSSPDQVIQHEFTVAVAGTVIVKLTGPAGEPVAGVAVGTARGFAYTDRNGRATLERLPPGSVEVSITPSTVPDRYRPVDLSKLINIEPGQTFTWNVTLENRDK